MIEHHIQRQIIQTLSSGHTIRFSELKPYGMESSAFTYHLRGLVRSGLIAKHDDGYMLTATGLQYVDSLSKTNNKPRVQPKLLCIFALKNSSGHYLFARRKQQPNIDKNMLPSGKQHYGESPETHIHREIKEQVGKDLSPHYSGYADIRIATKGVLVTHLAAQVYTAIYDGPAPVANAKFTYFWSSKQEVANTVVGTIELLEVIESSSHPFMLSLDVNDD